MDFSLSSQLFLDDDVDVDDADDFDLDFDEDHEYISDEEFEVTIDYDEYDSNDADVFGGELCLADTLDAFDSFEAALTESDYVDTE